MTTRYSVQVGNEIIKFEGPDDLSDKEIEALGDKELKTAKPGQTFPHSRFVPNEPPKPDQPKHSAAGAYFRSLPHGAMMNFDDEIAAAGNAAIPGMAKLDNVSGVVDQPQQSMWDSNSGGFWDAFHKNMAGLKGQNQADEEQHPTASFLGNLSGVMATLPAAGERLLASIPEAVRAAAKARPILSGMTIGGVTGAASGAGAGDGNRAQSAALGGLTGTALGGVLSGAIEAAPAITNYVKILFNKGQAASERAVQQLATALKRDGYDVAHPDFTNMIKSAIEKFTGKPVAIADLGQAVRSRTGVGLRTPSDQQIPALDRITERAAGAGQRLAGDIRANVAPRTDVHALDDELIAQRDAEAKTLRERALFEPKPDPATAISGTTPEAGVQRTVSREVVPTSEAGVTAATGQRSSRIVLDPMLQQLARLPLAQRALTPALKQAEAERELLATTGQDISHLPDLNRGSDLDMRTFDYLKRFMDDEVNRLYKRGDTSTFSAAEANQVKALRDTIRGRLREVVPEYGDYLDAYRGSSEMIDSLREGPNFTDLPPEKIMSGQSGRSEAGAELYRVGAARKLLDTVRGTRDGAAPATRILNSDESRSQLNALGLAPGNEANLNKAVAQERILNLLPRETQGSATAQRQMAQEDANAASSLHLPWNPASKFSWAGALLRGALGKVSTARNAQVNDAFLPRATSMDPSSIENTIVELAKFGKVSEANALRRALRARQSSGVLGPLIGSPVALPEDDNGR